MMSFSYKDWLAAMSLAEAKKHLRSHLRSKARQQGLLTTYYGDQIIEDLKARIKELSK